MGTGATGRAERGPRIAAFLRLLAALDEGTNDFEALRSRIDPERPPAVRTVRRYLADLSAAGFPWFYDKEKNVYRFDAQYSLRRLELSGDEVFGLATLRGIATSLGGQIGASIGGVTDKLSRVAGRAAAGAAERSVVRLQLSDPQLDPERGVIFAILQRAQRERQSVRFAYVDKRGKSSRRHVDPYGFVVSGGRVYVVAHDRGRGAKRVFALDGISGAAIAPQRFTMPPDFDIEAFAAGSVSGLMHAGEPVRVVVRFSPVVARAAIAERVVRERTIAQQDDGGVDITYVVADAGEFVRWTMKWGAEAEILEPPDVRGAAASVARAIAARYER
jgi:predicted DNA-binding transcriptional regulator YafY